MLDSKLYFTKAKDYIYIWFESEKESIKFLFMALSLEFLIRWYLCYISPFLNVDVSRRSSESILTILWFLDNKIHTNSFTECIQILVKLPIGFNKKEDIEFINWFVDIRNEELHWDWNIVDLVKGKYPNLEIQYFSIVKKILNAQWMNLSDLIWVEKATLLEHEIDQNYLSIIANVENKIKRVKCFYNNLTEQERKELIQLAEEVYKGYIMNRNNLNIERVCCPCCDNFLSLLIWTHISSSWPKLVNENIISQEKYFITKMKCFVCDLELLSHTEVLAAWMNEYFVKNIWYDPIQYHNIDVMEYATENHFDEIMEIANDYNQERYSEIWYDDIKEREERRDY